MPPIVNENRVLYIHCFGGHGRTGLVVAILLQELLGMSKESAMELLQKSHEKRGCQWCSLSRGRLESSLQEAQAKRLEPVMCNKLKQKK